MITCAQTVALRHAGKSQDNAGGTGRFFPGQGLIVGRGMPDFFGNQKGVADFGTLSGLWVAEINDERDSAVTVNRNWAISVGLVDSNLWRKLASLEKEEFFHGLGYQKLPLQFDASLCIQDRGFLQLPSALPPPPIRSLFMTEF
jgi:hypothetical protein